MRVLIVHNQYLHAGGEDTVVRAETELLKSRGMEVLQVQLSNRVRQDSPMRGRLHLLRNASWAPGSGEKMRMLCQRFRPDVAHIHNFWMRASPAVHQACRASGVPVVQTLHNFRLFCLNSGFVRDHKPCTDCLGHDPWRGVVRRCYHGSVLASAAVARMIRASRRRRIWEDCVRAFITPSENAREKLIRGNLPAERVLVKPNFTADPGPATLPPSACDTALYVGRLSPEKGVSLLLNAWARRRNRASGRLLIAGEGPLRAALEFEAAALGLRAPEITFAGRKAMAEVASLLQQSRIVVVPSVCEETFGMSIVESFAAGRPAIVFNLGGQAELIDQGRTGLKVPAQSIPDLAGALDNAFDSGAWVDRAGAAARAEYLARFTPERNFEELLRIYEFARSCR